MRLDPAMDYREQPPGPELDGLVKAFWSLEAGGGPEEWLEHRAVPDGCVELIRRLDGRSRWGGDQPECFAVGLIDEPVSFFLGGGARFAAVRLWPWTWSRLSTVPLGAMRGRWIAVEEPGLKTLCESLHDPAAAGEALAAALDGDTVLRRIGSGVTRSGSVAQMRRAAGVSDRTLQRWFERYVGLPPRRYLRLLRFQRAFAEAPGGDALADHALAHGFSDQAHMAREFRALAGVPARQARRRSKGPFLR